MRRRNCLVPLSLALAGCGRLEMLTTTVTPDQWLSTHPWLAVRAAGLRFILAEPSSTLFVYGLGVVLAVAASILLRRRGRSVSKLLWGAALLVWSVATFSAGTSYQAFSYEIKYASRAVGAWTSWWEIWYLVLFVASMDLIVAAVAFSSAKGWIRRALLAYAALDGVVYFAVVLVGALMPRQFLASFECMLLFVCPSFLLLFAVNVLRYMRTKRPLELRLLLSWFGLLAVIVAYFGFYLSGLSGSLWAKGLWFNENDLLHLGLVAWVWWLVAGVEKRVEDLA